MADPANPNDRAQDASAHSDEPPQDRPEDKFGKFLSGLAAQVLVDLGLMTNPLTNKTEADLGRADYTIDLLGVLQDKTRGNLTPEEDRYLKGMLAQLRMSYVDARERADKGAPAPEDKPEAAGRDQASGAGKGASDQSSEQEPGAARGDESPGKQTPGEPGQGGEQKPGAAGGDEAPEAG